MVIFIDNCKGYQENQNQCSYNYSQKANVIITLFKRHILADLVITVTKNSKINHFPYHERSNANNIALLRIQFHKHNQKKSSH